MAKIREPNISQKKFVNLKKFKVYEVLYRYEDLTRTLRLLAIAFFLACLVLTSTVIYVMSSSLEKSHLLNEEVRKTTQFLNDQKIINLKTLASSVASTYFSMSYFNSEKILESLLDYTCPSYATDTVLPKLQEFQRTITEASLIQMPIEIERAKIGVRKKVLGKKTVYIVSVPITVETSRKGSQKYERSSYTFLAMFTRSEPSLTNPYGVCLVDLGVPQ